MRIVCWWVCVIQHRMEKVMKRSRHPFITFVVLLLILSSGPKGASCLLYRESFAGTIELPLQIEVGQLIRLHRMKVTNIRIKKNRSFSFFH